MLQLLTMWDVYVLHGRRASRGLGEFESIIAQDATNTAYKLQSGNEHGSKDKKMTQGQLGQHCSYPQNFNTFLD